MVSYFPKKILQKNIPFQLWMTNITNLANTTDVNTLVNKAGYYTKIGAIKKKLDQDYG